MSNKCLVLIALLLIAQIGYGAEFRSGMDVTIPAGSTISDDLFAAGSNVNINGNVNGDILAFGSNVLITGRIAQDAMLAGGNVTITGRVGDDLRAAGGQIIISGPVADNANIAGGTITINSGSKVGRDLQVAGGAINLNGIVGRNLQVAGGDVNINGTVAGNVKVNASQLKLGPRAVIRGDLTYTSPQKAEIAEGARITGRTVYKPQPKEEKRAPSAAGRMFLWFWGLIGAFIVGAITIALAPRLALATIDTAMNNKPWMSLLVGLIVLAVTPVVIFVLMITLVGLPLALILLALYLISLYFAWIFAAMALGRWIFARFRRSQISLYLALLVGLVVLSLLTMIPFLGWLIHFAAILLGLGILAYQRYNMVCQMRTEGKL